MHVLSSQEEGVIHDKCALTYSFCHTDLLNWSFLQTRESWAEMGIQRPLLPTGCHFRWSAAAAVKRICQEVNRWKHRPFINRERWNRSRCELSSCGESQKPGKPGNKEHSKERLQDSWRRFCPLILTNFATLFGLNAWQSTEADLSISHSPLCREGSC